MRRVIRISVGFAVAILAGGLLVPIAAQAGEFRFVAGKVADGRAIWEPTSVVIDQSTDLKDGVAFVLENPTDKTHGFVDEGLYEYIPMKVKEQVDVGVETEVMTYDLRPIRVTVAPKETKKIIVHTAQLEGHQAMGRAFRYFCHLHKDVHLGGAIFVTP